MSNMTFSRVAGMDVTIEDADREKIEAAFAALANAGLKREALDSLKGNLYMSHCDECGRYWMEKPLLGTPSWVPEIYGRGRRVDTREIVTKLQEAGWKHGSFCEECIFKRAPKLAVAITALPNKDLKRFFKLYATRIEQLSREKGYQNNVPYRFHVALATELIRILPAKQRKAFRKLAEILATLEIF